MKIKVGLDKFRIIATVLIIAVHTFPLISINNTIDFIFTHSLCRIGVPFFFMVTGLFILSKSLENKKVLISYIKKILIIYLICMLIYLPINIYSGQLKNLSFLQLILNITINETFYHLWYFSALVLGIFIDIVSSLLLFSISSSIISSFKSISKL